ncbi:Gfo/Idh/MocA family oxidoreductase [Geobacillus sp. MR]|jgi:predicted dehydrogenase|uniref:Gfo/Idh/MocA family protein n=1 Tax=Geobacillus sp. MR TaxID=2508875 RepID=UPI00148E5E55|nr:Gfo/Idh/MocA family oxidoreductase [Geobacillus sp. MR]NNU88079.1 Gfo/Idh/MocA family oxidoreductase [Geobacillus sp. MR]
MQKVLLIGAGTMGKVHAKAYSEMDKAQLVGIVDSNQDKANELAEEVGTAAFYTFDEAMEKLKNIDVIDICLPTYFHKEYVKRAADAGKHVICEKPLARDLQEAREMITYCREKNVNLFVGHVVRFFPEYQKAKALLETGAIGKPAVVRTSRGGAFPTGWSDWYADFQKSGGLVLDLLIHDFDYLRWCFGEVERVYAKRISPREDLRLDYALVTLRFKNGVIAHVEGTWAHDGFAYKFEISGTKGIVDCDSTKAVPITTMVRTSDEGTAGVPVPESPLKKNPYFLELEHFLSCIETGDTPLVTSEDAYKAMEIAFAALQSIETGKPVTLNYSNVQC